MEGVCPAFDIHKGEFPIGKLVTGNKEVCTAEERGGCFLCDLPVFPTTWPELLRCTFSLKADHAAAVA